MFGWDFEDDVWSRFVFELVIRTQPSGPLCLWQCFVYASVETSFSYVPIVFMQGREEGYTFLRCPEFCGLERYLHNKSLSWWALDCSSPLYLAWYRHSPSLKIASSNIRKHKIKIWIFPQRPVSIMAAIMIVWISTGTWWDHTSLEIKNWFPCVRNFNVCSVLELCHI